MEDGPGTGEVEGTAEPGPSSTEIGAEALRGPAHLLGARILNELSVQGSATAAIPGRRPGESSGSTGYHPCRPSRFGAAETGPGGHYRHRAAG